MRGADARLLQRRPVHIGDLRYIGKEANKLDDVQAGLIGELGDVVTEYTDPNDDPFRRFVLSPLDGYAGRELARLVGTDRRTIDRIRGRQVPRPQLRDALFHLAVQQATDDLCAQEILPRDEARWTPPVTILTCWDRTMERGSSDNE